jgi:signal-transduction protein with cAMP-binding, CBS, and nucleotidyltransferase domain
MSLAPARVGIDVCACSEEVTMVGEICSKPAINVSPDTTVQEAAHRMRSRRVGAVVVVTVLSQRRRSAA